jgi:bis(5'-nucleosyl)-tetraphosphatase (symmetrical)
MATYAIGDVQGCFNALDRLTNQIEFDPSRDHLWFTGDLVNRGPDSLRVLRYIKDLGKSATTVLGNHDLFLIAVAAGIATLRSKDTIADVLNAPDRDDLITWLRRQRLVYRDQEFMLVHAGLLPQWSIDETEGLGGEVESFLQGTDYKDLLHALYPSRHLHQWRPTLTGPTRLAAIATVFTRLRVCTATGLMALEFSGAPSEAPPGYSPWFQIPGRQSLTTTIVCGHWAALGLHVTDNILALDSGCVWGNRLTAVRLHDRAVFQSSCQNGCRGD